MRVDLFDFDLPAERIALRPARPRDSARLLRSRATDISDHQVLDLPNLLRPGDVLVFNDTKVIPAQLEGTAGRCAASARPCTSARVRANGRPSFATPSARASATRSTSAKASTASVVEKAEDGSALLHFHGDEPVELLLERAGRMPLPPYIASKRAVDEADRDDYQTMFAREEGAVAAPTAALHFTPRLLEALDERGIGRETLTLHVGAGTFLPVKSERDGEHQMHAEWGRIDAATAERLNAVRASGGRLISVGTTSLRLLESAADDGRHDPSVRRRHGDLHHARLSLQGDRRADHQFPSAALDLVHAGQRADGPGRDEGGLRPRDRGGYRFYSYGDASLLLPRSILLAGLEPVAEVAADELAELVDLAPEMSAATRAARGSALAAPGPRPCSIEGSACGETTARPARFSPPAYPPRDRTGPGT